MVQGQVGRTTAGQVRAVRNRRQLSQRALSARLTELGRPLVPSAVAKIETGERRVDVDDLIALALALEVSPARLLLPDHAGDEPVGIRVVRLRRQHLAQAGAVRFATNSRATPCDASSAERGHEARPPS